MKIKLTQEEKKKVIPLIQRYYEEEKGEKIGNLAAEFLLDFFVKEIGPIIYNHAISDARKNLTEKMSDIEYWFHELEKPVSW